jgi:hypothetical protein
MKTELTCLGVSSFHSANSFAMFTQLLPVTPISRRYAGKIDLTDAAALLSSFWLHARTYMNVSLPGGKSNLN